MTIRRELERYWEGMAQLTRSIPLDDIQAAAEMILEGHDRGRRIFTFGNGGSAATASHFATDLGKGTNTEGFDPLRVISLNDNSALMTALANDLGYERVFAQQLAPLVEPGDVAVAISASGNSLNVLAAADVARAAGARVLALTGQTGGRLRRLADLSVRVPARAIEQVEDGHLMVAHSICVAIRQELQARAALLRLPAAGSRHTNGSDRSSLQSALDRLRLPRQP